LEGETVWPKGTDVSGIGHSEWFRQDRTLSPEFNGTSPQKSLRLSHPFCGGIAGGILIVFQKTSKIFQ
jgi:hypothetical protein